MDNKYITTVFHIITRGKNIHTYEFYHTIYGEDSRGNNFRAKNDPNAKPLMLSLEDYQQALIEDFERRGWVLKTSSEFTHEGLHYIENIRYFNFER